MDKNPNQWTFFGVSHKTGVKAGVILPNGRISNNKTT
jgi:hypothetical protein